MLLLRVLLLFFVMYQVACGPGAQVLEQQRRQIQANQQLIEENRRLLSEAKNRPAQVPQPQQDNNLSPATRFVMHAVALRANAVAGIDPATEILATIPGSALLTDGAKAEDVLPLIWSPFFENTVVTFSRVDSPAPVALYYNPLLDVAVFTQWEKHEQEYRVASIRALPGERLTNSSAVVSPRPYWLEADEGPIEALSRITAERIEAFSHAHAAQADGAEPTPTTDTDMQAALPRLIWNTVQRAEWDEEPSTWLQPALVSIDEALDARNATTLMAAAPATDEATASALSGLPEGFAGRLRLDMVLDGDEHERILIGSLPDDGDIYVFVTCRLNGTICALDRFLFVPLLG